MTSIQAIPFLWLYFAMHVIPIAHLILSRYWSQRSKVIWVVPLVLGQLIGYTIFLMATFYVARKRIKSYSITDSNTKRIFEMSRLVAIASRLLLLGAVIMTATQLLTGLKPEESTNLFLFLIRLTSTMYTQIYLYWFALELTAHLLLYVGEKKYATTIAPQQVSQQ